MRVILVATDASPPAPARKDPGAYVVNTKRLEIWHAGQVARFGWNSSGRVQFRGIAALLVRRGGFVTSDEFAEAVWGDDPTGGPLWVTNAHSQIMRRRMLPRMRALRLVKENARGLGARLVQQQGGAQ